MPTCSGEKTLSTKNPLMMKNSECGKKTTNAQSPQPATMAETGLTKPISSHYGQNLDKVHYARKQANQLLSSTYKQAIMLPLQVCKTCRNHASMHKVSGQINIHTIFLLLTYHFIHMRSKHTTIYTVLIIA